MKLKTHSSQLVLLLCQISLLFLQVQVIFGQLDLPSMPGPPYPDPKGQNRWGVKFDPRKHGPPYDKTQVSGGSAQQNAYHKPPQNYPNPFQQQGPPPQNKAIRNNFQNNYPPPPQQQMNYGNNNNNNNHNYNNNPNNFNRPPNNNYQQNNYNQGNNNNNNQNTNNNPGQFWNAWNSSYKKRPVQAPPTPSANSVHHQGNYIPSGGGPIQFNNNYSNNNHNSYNNNPNSYNNDHNNYNIEDSYAPAKPLKNNKNKESGNSYWNMLRGFFGGGGSSRSSSGNKFSGSEYKASSHNNNNNQAASSSTGFKYNFNFEHPFKQGNRGGHRPGPQGRPKPRPRPFPRGKARQRDQSWKIFTTLGKGLDAVNGGVKTVKKAVRGTTGQVLAKSVKFGGKVAFVGAHALAKVITKASSL